MFICKATGCHPRHPAFFTPNLPLWGGAPRSESKIFMIAGGNHTALPGVPLAVDVVISIIVADDTTVVNCPLPTVNDHYCVRRIC